jgi:hypothetical protein
MAMWWLSALVLMGPGCAGSTSGAGDVAQTIAIPGELADQSWVVALSEEASLGRYAAKPGWVSLVMKRNYADAVRQLGPEGGLPAARAHAEMANLYRQAALMSAYSLIEVYGKTAEPTDPLGVAHLLTVSYAITGQLDLAKGQAEKAKKLTNDPTAAWDAPWQAWLAAGAQWPPDLSGLPIQLPPPRPGDYPDVTQIPSYSLPERGGSSASREMADPGALVALALWHESAAALAKPDALPMVRAMRAGYRLPVEPPPAPAGDLPMELLFGSDHLVPSDADFLADLEGAGGVAAVDKWKGRSIIAWLASQATADGKLDGQKAIDVAAALRTDLLARTAAKTDGKQLNHQRTFADIAYVGALRSLALVAERAGDRETSGLLRINALEKSDKATACPVGLMALAAWDASNRYPMRAQDILHNQTPRYPSLDIARYGLDVLSLRVGTERTGETAGM